MPDPTSNLNCRLCGHPHLSPALTPGDEASCIRCGTALIRCSRFGPEAVRAFTLTALLLAGPALTLPFVTTGKLGLAQTRLVFAAVEGFWDHGMRLLSVWICLCGVIVPVGLLATLAILVFPAWFGRKGSHSGPMIHAAHALGHWAMPEVQMLAVLVAFVKLGNLVDVTVGPAFWCYGAMSFMLLLAWRTFDLSPASDPADGGLSP